MKNKRFLIPMIITGLLFAFGFMWIASEIWMKWSSVTHDFNMKSIPTFVITLGLYGLFYVMYYGKSKYKQRKITPIGNGWYVTENSQTPIKL